MLTDVKMLQNADLEKKYFCCTFAQRLKEGYAAPLFLWPSSWKLAQRKEIFAFKKEKIPLKKNFFLFKKENFAQKQEIFYTIFNILSAEI